MTTKTPTLDELIAERQQLKTQLSSSLQALTDALNALDYCSEVRHCQDCKGEVDKIVKKFGTPGYSS